ncbi:MAG: hypothetical protein JWL83_4759 [Actinomycetia bacterium]|nr:hypothetical protein [Actinomycetes bacterium]
MPRKRTTDGSKATTATTPVAAPSGPRYAGTGIWPPVIAGLVLATAVVIFVAQNAHVIGLKFLWVHFRTSPAVLVLATAVLSVAGAVIVGAMWRRRRRQVLREREELEQLRTVVEPAPAPDVDLTSDTPRPFEPPAERPVERS